MLNTIVISMYTFDNMALALSRMYFTYLMVPRISDGNGNASGDKEGSLDRFPAVAIDIGTQKYVLIEAEGPNPGQRTYLVRGNIRAEYHKDAARDTVRELGSLGIRYRVLGGGRIKHDADKKSIRVYGHSYGFPWEVLLLLSFKILALTGFV